MNDQKTGQQINLKPDHFANLTFLGEILSAPAPAKRGPGRPPKHPWRSIWVGDSFVVKRRFGQTSADLKKNTQTAASRYYTTYGEKFSVTPLKNAVKVTRIW